MINLIKHIATALILTLSLGLNSAVYADCPRGTYELILAPNSGGLTYRMTAAGKTCRASQEQGKSTCSFCVPLKTQRAIVSGPNCNDYNIDHQCAGLRPQRPVKLSQDKPYICCTSDGQCIAQTDEQGNGCDF